MATKRFCDRCETELFQELIFYATRVAEDTRWEPIDLCQPCDYDLHDFLTTAGTPT